MKLRSKIYFARKKAQKYLKSPMGAFSFSLYDDLIWYGMAGTRTFLDEQGNVRVDRLSFGAMHELKEALERGESISEEYSFLIDRPLPYDLKKEVEKLKLLYKLDH